MISYLEETLLWQIRCSQNCPEPQREYRFAPPRRWRLDLAWPAKKVAVEVEGATYSRGRHTRGSGFQKDAEKHNAAALAGWRVLRVTARDIKRGVALNLIERALCEG